MLIQHGNKTFQSPWQSTNKHFYVYPFLSFSSEAGCLHSCCLSITKWWPPIKVFFFITALEYVFFIKPGRGSAAWIRWFFVSLTVDLCWQVKVLKWASKRFSQNFSEKKTTALHLTVKRNVIYSYLLPNSWINNISFHCKMECCNFFSKKFWEDTPFYVFFMSLQHVPEMLKHRWHEWTQHRAVKMFIYLLLWVCIFNCWNEICGNWLVVVVVAKLTCSETVHTGFRLCWVGAQRVETALAWSPDRRLLWFLTQVVVHNVSFYMGKKQGVPSMHG